MNNILNKEVSLFKNYFSPKKPSTINLLEYLQGGLNNEPFPHPPDWMYGKMIKPGYRLFLEKYFIGQPLEKCIELYRKDRKEKGKTDFNELIKKLLPAVTVSGTFKKRSNEDLIKHSGLMCLDVDYKDNTNISNFDHLKEQLCNLVNVAYCGLSVSGKGYFIIIPILYPDKHEQHFNSLVSAFGNLDLLVDEKCRDVSRLRGFSVDKNAYFNPNPVPYAELMKPKPKLKIYQNFNAKTEIGAGIKVEKLIEEICRQRIDLTFDYADWYSIGCAFANEFGETGRNYFHLVSQFYSKHDHQETDKQYNACLKSNSTATINTFYKLCGLRGVLIKELCYSSPITVKPQMPPANFKKQDILITESMPEQETILFNKVLKIEKEFDLSPYDVERLFDDNLNLPKDLPDSTVNDEGHFCLKVNKDHVIFYTCYKTAKNYEHGNKPIKHISITSALTLNKKNVPLTRET